MTLIVTAATPEYVVMVSDRRLTRRLGKRNSVWTEEENKSIFWDTPSGRDLIGYTGVARIHGEPTTVVLMNLLGRATVESGYDLDKSMHLFRKLLGEKVSSLRRSERRLTVLFSGFVSQDYMVTAYPGFALVTNFQDWENNIDSPFAWDDFTINFWTPRADVVGPFSFIQYAGDYLAIPDEQHNDEVRPMLEREAPPHAVVDKLVELFRSWADRSEASAKRRGHGAGVIGKQLSSTVLRVSAINEPTGAYHSMHAGCTYRGTAAIKCRPEFGYMMISGFEIAFDEEGGPTVVPPTRPGWPCTCGSGKRYRHCHGRFNPHHLPKSPE